MSNKSILKKVISAVAVLSLSSQVSFAGTNYAVVEQTRTWYFGDNKDNKCKLNLETGELLIFVNAESIKFSDAFADILNDEISRESISIIKVLVNEKSIVDIDKLSCCPNLDQIEIYGNVGTIRSHVFDSLKKLESIKIFGGVKCFEEYAICNDKLSSLYIGGECTLRPGTAIAECHSLSELRIPKGVVWCNNFCNGLINLSRVEIRGFDTSNLFSENWCEESAFKNCMNFVK